MITIVRAVQTSVACPAQWDAYDADGNYYYLRFRSGCGSVRQYADPDWWMIPGEVTDGMIADIASFRHGDPLDGSIGLAEFCELAGLELAEDLDHAGSGQHMTDGLIFAGVTEILAKPPVREEGPS